MDIWPSNIRVKDLLLKCGMPACHACRSLTGKTTYSTAAFKKDGVQIKLPKKCFLTSSSWTSSSASSFDNIVVIGMHRSHCGWLCNICWRRCLCCSTLLHLKEDVLGGYYYMSSIIIIYINSIHMLDFFHNLSLR